MAKLVACILGFGVLVLRSVPVFTAEPEVPSPLEDWRGWVLHGEEFRRCPFFNQSGATDARHFVCGWPERLTLDLDARGGRFSQRWTVFAPSWLLLPGNLEHWPDEVRVNGAPAPVVVRAGTPQVWVKPGSYSFSGSFHWSSRPEALAVPASTGIVDLTIDGRRVSQAERVDGGVWLGKRRSAEQQQQMDIQVYRLVRDEIPVQLETRIRLQVAGEGREELLAAPLPGGFVPLTLNSELPARLEPNGRLRVQVRPGSWEIMLVSRGADVAGTVKAPAGDGPWAKEEIWSFAGNDRLRVVAVEGAAGIDPSQAGVPPEWRQSPSYRLERGAELKIVERSRGLSAADDNQLNLYRKLWLDFNHEGFTAVDTLTGRMRSGWRLDMAAPYRLLSAESNGENLLITQSAQPGFTGVEVRTPNVNLTAVSRIEGARKMSAAGWQARFDNIRGELNLPPGHRLFAAVGADEAPGSWVKRWCLLDMFLVLIVSVAIARLLGWPMGVVALIALALTRHESASQIWLWANLLIAAVLAREAPEGRLKRVAVAYRHLSFAALLVALIPFVVQQVRLAIYPQLEAGAPLELSIQHAETAATPALNIAVPPPPEADMQIVEEESEGRDRSDEMKRRAEKTEEIVVTGSLLSKRPYPMSLPSNTQRYAPGTLVQTGPGVPAWRFNTYSYFWSGPVEAAQQLRFVILTPFWVGLWRIAGCALLALLFLSVVRLSFGWPHQLPQPRFRRTAAAAIALLMTGALLISGGNTAQAKETPDAAILNELKTRLTRAPECVPSCAEITAARVKAAGDRVDVELDVSALANVAVPVPAAAGRWEPETIAVDGQTNAGLYRDGQRNLWVPLRPGAHQLKLSGRITAAQSVQLVFPQPPRSIEAGGEEWEFSGISARRLLTNTLELVRKRAAGTQAQLESSLQFAPFVRVRRHLNFDLDWGVTTIVERIAPDKGAFTLEIPLLPRESVLTGGVETVKDRAVLVAMSAGQNEFRWNSALPRTESLALIMPKDVSRTEVWSFAVSPQWNVQFNGTPAALPENVESGSWTYEFHPRTAEQLKVQVARPAAAQGPTLAIDRVALNASLGKRSTDAALRIDYRSTQGGRHVLRLPEDARVTKVEVDGRSIALRPESGELAVGLLPGKHVLSVDWQTATGATLWTQAPQVDLRSPASNISTRIDLPASRWVLFAHGPGVGPAILFWGELILFVVLAVLIGRTSWSPLKTHEWLLLGLGLSTFSWSVLLIFATWLFLIRWRERWSAETSRTRFNLRQVALGLLSVVALASLIAAVPHGLLSSPDMRVHNAEFGAGLYSWFNDRAAGVLPQPVLISVSLWWYKAAMLAWALWLSFALLRWLPWAWRAFTKDGLWRGKVAAAAAT